MTHVSKECLVLVPKALHLPMFISTHLRPPKNVMHSMKNLNTLIIILICSLACSTSFLWASHLCNYYFIFSLVFGGWELNLKENFTTSPKLFSRITHVPLLRLLNGPFMNITYVRSSFRGTRVISVRKSVNNWAFNVFLASKYT